MTQRGFDSGAAHRRCDQAKGRVKEAVGSLTNDKDLKHEGRSDRLAGEAKEKVEDAIDEVKEKLGQANDKVEDAIGKTKEP